jgi:hypothetical protein
MHFKLVSSDPSVQDLLSGTFGEANPVSWNLADNAVFPLTMQFGRGLLPIQYMGVHHRQWVLSFPSVTGADALTDYQFGLTLYRTLLVYQEMHNLDIVTNGFRFTALFHQSEHPVLYVGHDNIAPVDPRDWAADDQPWFPVEYEKSPFFSAADQSFDERLPRVLFNGDEKNILLYLPEGSQYADSGIFAMEDGTVKALVHYLVLSRGLEGTFLDESVSITKWLGALAMAHRVAELCRVGNNQSVRIVSNIGQGYQAAPIAHIHVQVDTNFGDLNPEDFGFEVKNRRVVFVSPEQESAYKRLMEKFPPRSSHAGFSQALKNIFRSI